MTAFLFLFTNFNNPFILALIHMKMIKKTLFSSSTDPHFQALTFETIFFDFDC